MRRNWGFCDLHINKKINLEKLEVLEKLGYNTIALNTFVEEANDDEPKKKKKKGETKEKKDYIPPPIEIPEAVKGSKLNILQRVTVELSESSIAHKMNQSENLKKYDIIAVLPRTAQAFQYACGSMDVDMITFDHQIRIPYKVSRKLYNQAVERGLFFELMYSPAIMDRSARKNIIATAHAFHAVGKSRNIVVTSAAEDYNQLRDVHDVINIGFILGLNTNQSLEVVRSNAKKLILRSQARRHGKHFMTITELSAAGNMGESASKTNVETVDKI